jgi:hypothetical protein
MAAVVAAGTAPVLCGCARCLRRAAAPCAHHSPLTPATPPLPHCRAATAAMTLAANVALGRTRRAAPRGRCAMRGAPSTVTVARVARRRSTVTVT